MAGSKGIKIRFEADDNKLRSSLSNVEKEAKELTKQLKQIDKLLELDPTNTNLLTQKQELLAKAAANTAQKLEAMEKAQEHVTNGYKNWEKNRQAIEACEQSIAVLRQKHSELWKVCSDLVFLRKPSKIFFNAFRDLTLPFRLSVAHLDKQGHGCCKGH